MSSNSVLLSAIILAAGSSSRMGRSKQLLPWGGVSLIRRAASSAIEAGCSPVVVVVGSGADEVRAELAGAARLDRQQRPLGQPAWAGRSTLGWGPFRMKTLDGVLDHAVRPAGGRHDWCLRRLIDAWEAVGQAHRRGRILRRCRRPRDLRPISYVRRTAGDGRNHWREKAAHRRRRQSVNRSDARGGRRHRHPGRLRRGAGQGRSGYEARGRSDSNSVESAAVSTMTLSQLAEHIGATVDGDGSTPVHGVATLEDAGPATGQLPVEPQVRKAAGELTKAAAVIVGNKVQTNRDARCCARPTPTWPTRRPSSHCTATAKHPFEGVHPRGRSSMNRLGDRPTHGHLPWRIRRVR